MIQGIKLQSSFLHDLFVLASRPATRLDGLLQLVLEKALEVTASDAGGGLFILETSGREPALVASSCPRSKKIFTSVKILSSDETL